MTAVARWRSGQVVARSTSESRLRTQWDRQQRGACSRRPPLNPVEGTACGLIGLIGAACVLVVGERHCQDEYRPSTNESPISQPKTSDWAKLPPMKADLRLLCCRGRKDFSPHGQGRTC